MYRHSNHSKASCKIMTDQEEWKMAKVSILMPACNVEKFLKECNGQCSKSDFKGHRDYLHR